MRTRPNRMFLLLKGHDGLYMIVRMDGRLQLLYGHSLAPRWVGTTSDRLSFSLKGCRLRFFVDRVRASRVPRSGDLAQLVAKQVNEGTLPYRAYDHKTDPRPAAEKLFGADAPAVVLTLVALAIIAGAASAPLIGVASIGRMRRSRR